MIYQTSKQTIGINPNNPGLIIFRLHNLKNGGEQGKREDIYVWCIFNQKKGEHDSISAAEEKSEVTGQGKR
jgi:hypothetical protein